MGAMHHHIPRKIRKKIEQLKDKAEVLLEKFKTNPELINKICPICFEPFKDGITASKEAGQTISTAGQTNLFKDCNHCYHLECTLCLDECLFCKYLIKPEYVNYINLEESLKLNIFEYNKLPFDETLKTDKYSYEKYFDTFFSNYLIEKYKQDFGYYYYSVNKYVPKKDLIDRLIAESKEKNSMIEKYKLTTRYIKELEYDNSFYIKLEDNYNDFLNKFKYKELEQKFKNIKCNDYPSINNDEIYNSAKSVYDQLQKYLSEIKSAEESYSERYFYSTLHYDTTKNESLSSIRSDLSRREKERIEWERKMEEERRERERREEEERREREAREAEEERQRQREFDERVAKFSSCSDPDDVPAMYYTDEWGDTRMTPEYAQYLKNRYDD